MVAGNAAPASFGYLFDPNALVTGNIGNGVATVIETGKWRAVTPGDLGTSIGSVNVSGIDTLLVDTDELEAQGFAISGNTAQANLQLASISGNNANASVQLAALSGQAWGNTSLFEERIVSGFGQVLAANPLRKAWFIMNLATGQLMLKLGSSVPTTGSMNMVLKGSTAINDGLGASWSDDQGRYRGAVFVSGLGGAPILATAWQI